MVVFTNKKRKAVTIAVNCLLGAAVFAGGLLADAAVARAEVLAKYKNGTPTRVDESTVAIVAFNPDNPLEFYSPEDAPTDAVDYTGEREIAGYYKNGDVENATLIIHGGTFNTYVYGGYAAWSANNNTLTISGGTFDGNHIYGGYSKKSSATSNTVTISGGTFDGSLIYGGKANDNDSGSAIGNTVNISGGDFTGTSICGGSTLYGSADKNTVNISGGTIIEGMIYGGAAANTASANDNTVNISGGTFEGFAFIIGGLSDEGEVRGNTVNITAGCDLSNVLIMGGEGTGDVRGNTLNIKASGVKANSISKFSNLNFYVPATAVNGDTMLEVVDAADITGSTIRAGVVTGSNLKKGDTINLLEATTLTYDETESMAADLTGTGLVKIDGTVERKDKSIVLTINEDVSQSLAEESKSLVETRAGGMALLNTAFDLTTGKGFANAQAAAEAENNATDDGVTKNTDGVRTQVGFTPYVAVGGANMRYETGSYVDSKGWGINVGLSRIINYENSKLTLAPFVEYGKASYDSYLENATNTHGSGDNSFTGIGFMAKNEQKDGLYYEGSVRFGRAKGDYQGDASTYGSNYDTASNYLAFHAGIGKVQKLNDKNSIDYYGKLFYTHQNGDTVNIHSTLGDAGYDFDAINSYRLRLGARWNQKLGQRDKLYAGLAWDYEFDSEARAHYNGMSTPAPSMKGSSGMLELGWKQEATKDNPFGVDVGVTGWCGKQRGVQFNAGFSWAF